MTSMIFASDPGGAVPLYLVRSDGVDPPLNAIGGTAPDWAKACAFKAGLGECLLVPGDGARPKAAVVGLGGTKEAKRQRFLSARARAALPPGTYRLEAWPDDLDLTEAALGWLLAGYRFTRYHGEDRPMAGLIAPDGVDAARLERIAAGEALTRDLINTPSNDMGPAELEQAARDLGSEFGAAVEVTVGDDLKAANLPLIHAVGRASARAPRLVDLRWGTSGPALTLVGKGVCFDTGGLNLKPGASMALMKKDMGGAAMVLGLARMIMASGLPLRLRVLLPIAENAVSGLSFRPGDILTSRKGLTVEINNTDAEGRLILADALALADEETPDLTISIATLTGAARVAVGPDLAPFFTDDPLLAELFESAGRAVRDPVWRLPFWDPYDSLIEPGIADLDNAPSGGMAGAITAALFLRRFAPQRYIHIDAYGWQQTAAPGRPKGGVGQATRALFEALPRMLG